MPTCLGKNSLLCVSFVNIYQFACVVHAFFGFEGGAWYLIVQSTLVISTSVISNNRLSRRENLIPV